MEIIKQLFGVTSDQKEIYSYTLKNDHQVEVDILTYGAIIRALRGPDKNGKIDDVVLGYDKLALYENDQRYFGAIVGRYANRIAHGSFTIQEKRYNLSANHGMHHLHGGFDGFDKKNWEAETRIEKGFIELKLSCISADGEEGYPGNLMVQVHYKLDNDNALHIEFAAKTDQDTHVNLTNHTYFNLTEGKQNIFSHNLQILAGQYTETDGELIPTGKILPVDDTVFDFREKKNMGDQIIKNGNTGYDVNYVVEKKGNDIMLAAILSEPESGRSIEVYTTQPGMQLYTGHFIGKVTGKQQLVYNDFSGICLETQHFPDSPNHKGFPATLISPEKSYNEKIIWQFRW